MRRIDRALLIHRQVLALDAQHGSWQRPVAELPDVRVRVIDAGSGWHAWMTNPFSGPPTDHPAPGSYAMAVALERKQAAQLPNLLDLWLDGSAKVLSIEWSEHDMRIIGMKRGSWESSMFGLPPGA